MIEPGQLISLVLITFWVGVTFGIHLATPLRLPRDRILRWQKLLLKRQDKSSITDIEVCSRGIRLMRSIEVKGGK